jgi:2-oxoglutarate ferredoxin oxidoreductase subunit delta
MPGLASRLLRHLPFDHRGRISTPYVALNRSLCKACWRCVAACPESVLGKVEVGSHKHAVVDARDRCTGCGSCVEACRAGALTSRHAA